MAWSYERGLPRSCSTLRHRRSRGHRQEGTGQRTTRSRHPKVGRKGPGMRRRRPGAPDTAHPAVTVGLAGFEPTTPGTQSQCATKLRYSPHTTADRDDGRSLVPISPRPLRRTRDPPTPGTLYATGWRSRPTRGPPSARGRSSMVEPQSSKLATRVRFPSPARTFPQVRGHMTAILERLQDFLSLFLSLHLYVIMVDPAVRTGTAEHSSGPPIGHRPTLSGLDITDRSSTLGGPRPAAEQRARAATRRINLATLRPEPWHRGRGRQRTQGEL